MRAVILPLLFTAGAAEAHPGHIAEVAGHGHWIAAGAIGIAVAVGLWTKWRDRDTDPADEAEDESAEEQSA
ncbi:DUF6732 family protein [Histidinibacterium aquaticum]|uniref:Uncharacterized protein n=1 Tax=Histidinibacterium aquaticum TaxID=2613962 RepID=A0A5J5GFQ5_9RHOB|nr:DUF6732 family protein [Histidinibacterium aquaticum]KAA9007049.1 hypothetical protein F3S47_14895 [Histidinibacterium aquaticum]